MSRRVKIPKAVLEAAVAAGKSDAEIGCEYGLKRKDIWDRRQRLGVAGAPRHRCADHDDTIRHMVAEGRSDCEIAAAIGYNRTTVTVRRRKLGLAPRGDESRRAVVSVKAAKKTRGVAMTEKEAAQVAAWAAQADAFGSLRLLAPMAKAAVVVKADHGKPPPRPIHAISLTGSSMAVCERAPG